jgi:predicted secreted protein
MKRFLVAAVLLAGLVGPVAANVTLHEAALCKDVTLQVGQNMCLALVENPSTGFQWSCAWKPTVCLKLTQDKYVAPIPGSPPGSPGMRYFTLQGLALGDCRVDIQYARTWKGGEADTPRSLHVVVVPPAVGPAPPPVIKLTEDDFKPNQVVALNSWVTVRLPENAGSTGYVWKQWWDPPDALRLIEDKYLPPTGTAIGAPGTHLWVYKTLLAETVAVYFQSYQPWSGGGQDTPRLLVLQIPAS